MVRDTNVSRGMKRRAEKGKIITRVPFGYVLRDGDPTVVREEADIVKLIFELYYNKDEEMGYADIAYYLNSQDLLRRGKEWTRGYVRRVVNNRFYYGKVIINGEEFEGDFKPILEKEYIDPGKTGKSKEDK